MPKCRLWKTINLGKYVPIWSCPYGLVLVLHRGIGADRTVSFHGSDFVRSTDDAHAQARVGDSAPRQSGALPLGKAPNSCDAGSSDGRTITLGSLGNRLVEVDRILAEHSEASARNRLTDGKRRYPRFKSYCSRYWAAIFPISLAVSAQETNPDGGITYATQPSSCRLGSTSTSIPSKDAPLRPTSSRISARSSAAVFRGFMTARA